MANDLKPALRGFLKLAAIGQPTLKLPITDAAQASAAMAKYIHPDAYTWLGMSQMKRGCGDLIEASTGKKVAHVAYNGRIFDLDNNLLFDPSAEA
jgi:hypothetical protein